MEEVPVDRMPCVVSVTVRGSYSVLLRFDDGVSKQVNLRPLLEGPVFEPLHDPSEFAKVRVDSEAGTIVWPNDADIAPETLYLLPDERETAA